MTRVHARRHVLAMVQLAEAQLYPILHEPGLAHFNKIAATEGRV